MNRGLKFDLLLAATLAYIYVFVLFYLPLNLPVFSDAINWLLMPSNFVRELFSIVLGFILLVAPALVVFWFRPKDRKALRFYLFWLLALGCFFLFPGLLIEIHYPLMIFLIIPGTIILLWLCYFFFSDKSSNGSLPRRPIFFYTGVIFTLIGTALFLLLDSIPYRHLHWFGILSLLSPNGLLLAVIAYIVSIFRPEEIRWPALALLLISFIEWLYVRNQIALSLLWF